MAERLCKLFKENISKIIPTVKNKEKMEIILNSMNAKNMTDSQFFDEVKNSLKIPIHYIEIGQDEEKELNSFKCFYLEATGWKSTDIEELLKVKTCVLLYKFGSTFYYFATFTSDWTNDERINLFLRSENAIMVQIGIDLLMKDPKSPKLRYMCENLNVCSVNCYGKALFQILYESNRNDAIEFVLQNECLFPEYLDEQPIPLVKERLKLNKKFHEFIKEENIEAIKKFLQANPNQCYLNNELNESACATAIKMKKYQLYSFLHERNLIVRKYEAKLLTDYEFLFFHFTQGLTYEKYSDKLLHTLISNTYIVNEKKSLNVYGVYKQLVQIPKFELILELLYILTSSIIVDCQEENISKNCPYVCGQTRGLYGSELNRIFISEGAGTEQMLVTFAHELTHFAMDALYNNNAEPYQSSDDERKNDYTKIVEDIGQKVANGQIREEIIQLVYTYPKDQWHSELIVCVNHMIAYHGYEKGFQILIEEAFELINFYYIKIVPDLDQYLRMVNNLINNRFFNLYSLQEIESKCKEYKFKSNNLLESVTQTPGHVVIETNCVHLTRMKLFSNITDNGYFNLNNTYMVSLLWLLSNINLASSSHFQKYELLIVADLEHENKYGKISWTNIKDYVDQSGKRFIFVIEKKETLPFQTSNYKDIFNWTDFDETSQKLIFNKLEVNFQENKIKLSELIDYEDNSKVLNELLSIEIIRNFIFCQSIPTVATKRLRNSEHYIERELTATLFELDELSDDIAIKYYCENITDESSERNFKLETNDGELITFPGKKLTKIWDASNSNFESSVQNSTELVEVYDDIKTDMYILTSSNCATTSIFIDGDKEIQMNDFSYSDLLTLHESNTNINIHWFQESETRPYFYHHLKTFGLVDKIRFTLGVHYQENYTITACELFEKLEHQKIKLIAATAEVGKVGLLRNMAKQLVEKDPSIWAPVLLLRRNEKRWKPFDAENTDFDKMFDFLTELLQLKSRFEKELFKFLCNNKKNNVHLFIDIDEINPAYEIFQLIETISKTNIKCLTVSVRLDIKNEFENRLQTVAIVMEPLLYDDQIRLMTNIWKNEQSGITKKISRGVINYFRDFNEILNNPLQILLMANICIDVLPEFSKNILNINHYFLNEFNLMEAYRKFYDKTVNIGIKEQRFMDLAMYGYTQLPELLTNDTKNEVKFIAVGTLLNDNEVKLFLSQEAIKCGTKFASVLNLANELSVETHEDIIDDFSTSGDLNFVHRTYAEYFFADFLINDWKNWRTKEGEYFFFDDILVKEKFKYVRKFLNSNKEISNFLSRKPIHYQVPDKHHGAVFQNFEENNFKILKCLHTLGFRLIINPSTLISKYINNDTPSSIIKLIDTITDLVTNCNNVNLPINELKYIAFDTLYHLFSYDCDKLIKALLKCKVLLDDKLPQNQTDSFSSLWNEAKFKAEAITANEDDESEELFKLFKRVVDSIRKK